VRVAARGIHAGVTAVSLVMYLVLAAVQGSLAGFSFPFDLGMWAISFAFAGWIITGSDPHHGVGRVLTWAGTVAAVYGLSGQAIGVWEAEFAAAADRWPGLALAGFLVLGQLYVVVMWLVVTGIGVFPDGRFPNPIARVAHVVFTIGMVVQALIWASEPDDEALYLDLPLRETVPWLEGVLAPVMLAAIVIVFGSSLVAMLRGGVVRRRQLGWVVVSIAAMVGLIALGNWTPDPVGSVLGMLAFAVFPWGVVIAVTRYRLYEIDRIVSRTVTYVVVIGVLVAVYAALVLLLGSLLPDSDSPVPVALSTLAVAFAFFPLARRVQGFVDRRFFRSRYDAATVVASFASELRGTIDEAAVADRAVSVVDQVFAPEAVGVWLAES
jgi:MFS family permease